MKSKILLALVLVAVVVSLYLAYDRSIVKQDFEIYSSEELF